MSRWHRYPDEIPESSGRVIVQSKYLDSELSMVPYSDKYKAFNVCDSDDNTDFNINEHIIAWMEAPKKYKEIEPQHGNAYGSSSR